MGNRKEIDDTVQGTNENDRSNRPLLDSGSPKAQGFDINEKSNLSQEVPVKDKNFIVYGVFLLFGIACLLPWNVFITATSYFVDYKLNTNESANATYRKDFTFHVGNIGQMTNVIMNLINICITFGGNPKNRIPYTIMLCSGVIVFQIALAIVDSQTWPFVFFILCCISVFVMYIATGIMNSCVYFVSSIFPMEYINAIILGNNLAGCFTAVVSILSKQMTSNLRLAAIYYFLATFLVLMMAFVGYFLMHRTDFYKYHARKAEEKKRQSLVESPLETKAKVPYIKIFKKTGLLLFCIWLNFFSTLAIFPVYNLGVKRSSENFIIPESSFQDILTFITFNFAVTIGNMIPKLIRWPGPKWIALPVILRAVFVFLFFAFCNFKSESRNHIPILISNDYVYWVGCVLSPLLFGYFTSLLMMYTPQIVPEHAGSVSMIAGLLIAIGVATGLQFTKILEFIVLA